MQRPVFKLFLITAFLPLVRLQFGGTRPNFMLILADDLGFSDIGYNNEDVSTPHLDKLAKNGRTLLNNYFQSTCTPSRAALLTGKYPHTIEMEMALQPATTHCLPTNLKLLPAFLQDAGYTTHLIGKWHLGFCQEDCLPNKRGFDTFDGFYVGMGDYYNHTDCEGFQFYDWHEDGQPDKSVHGDYVTSLITEKADAILDAHDAEAGPFFMFLSQAAPHVPLQGPDEYIEKYVNVTDDTRRRTYLGQVSAFDHEVGQIVSSLKANDLYDNTIILFSSDNGGESFHAPSNNGQFRGTKASLWEGGVRTPGFIHSPLLDNDKQEHDGLIHVVDWFPSILSMAGVDPDVYANHSVDGIDQSAMLLRGEASNRTEVVININNKSVSFVGHNAIRVCDYKLLWGFVGIGDGWGLDTFISFDPNFTVVYPPNPTDDIVEPYGRFFAPSFMQGLVAASISAGVTPGDFDSGEVHLYNVEVDPGETNDLANLTEYQNIVTNLKYRILNHTANIIPLPAVPARPTEAIGALVNGTWSTGWCDDLDISTT